ELMDHGESRRHADKLKRRRMFMDPSTTAHMTSETVLSLSPELSDKLDDLAYRSCGLQALALDQEDSVRVVVPCDHIQIAERLRRSQHRHLHLSPRLPPELAEGVSHLSRKSVPKRISDPT